MVYRFIVSTKNLSSFRVDGRRKKGYNVKDNADGSVRTLDASSVKRLYDAYGGSAINVDYNDGAYYVYPINGSVF